MAYVSNHFHVIHGRRTIYLVFLLTVIAVSFWVVFQPGVPQPASTNVRNWQQYAPSGSVSGKQDNEIVVDVFAVSSERVVEELDQEAHVVSVVAIPTKFSEYRMERARIRSRQLELLESIVYDKSLSEQRREAAQADLLELIALLGRETELENLLKAQGYIDAIAILAESAATIVVPVTLTKEEAERIGDLVKRMTGVRLDRITIVDDLSRA